MKIVANSVVKNEIYWFPYGIASCIDNLDHIFICDTGSTDGTKEIIKDYFIPKYPDKITLIEEYPEQGDDFTYKFPGYKNNLVNLSREFGADWMLCLDGDEVYYDFYFPEFKKKIENLNPRWRMIAVNTRYFSQDLNHVRGESYNYWHYRFFDLNRKGCWVLPYGDIDWGNPKHIKSERLTLEVNKGKIDMAHLSFLNRSPNDDKATARIRRQEIRKSEKLDSHNFGIPLILRNQELYELTNNPYAKEFL